MNEIVEEADNLGLRALTLYAFSTENWSRPQQEVLTLFDLLKKFLLRERKKIIRSRLKQLHYMEKKKNCGRRVIEDTSQNMEV